MTVPDGRVLAVIPARLASQRLPGKPLHPIAGRPLIAWVWDRVSSMDVVDACVVATDADAVAEACASFGASAEMTAAHHASGTDRVAEVAARETWADYGIVVNVQGDEPFVTAEQVEAAVAEVRRGRHIGTAATPVRTLAAWRDPAVVKVARRSDGAALYFSRAPIPWKRDGEPSEAELSTDTYLRHVGVYAFTQPALRRWTTLPAAELEEVERLEQLRALAAGLSIGVGLVERAEGGIDTPADVERAEARLRAGATATKPEPGAEE